MKANKLALIGAMKEEIDLLISQMEGVKESRKAGIVFREGMFYGKPVVVCMTGVGKVNAAVCTQTLIDIYGVDAVIFTGVAGALDPDLDIGDIVVSTESMQHDMDVTALGYEKGIIPYQEVSIFPADPALAEMAINACERMYPGRAKKGRILSGDQFIASRETVDMLHRELNGICTEMEGAAVAQVCVMNGVPYVVIRSMSDKADGSADVNFAEFTVEASERSYRIVEEMVKQMHA